MNSQPDPSNPERVAVVSESEMKDFRQLYRAINAYGNKHRLGENGIPHDLETVVLAFYNNQWHRAVVVKTTGDGFPWCLLIDLENIQKIRVKDLIPMPRIFANPPPLVRLCRIEGFNKDSSSAVKTVFGDIVKENQMLKVDKIFEDDDDNIVLHLEAIVQLSKSNLFNRGC